MEPKNHPFENKNHLPSTSTIVFHLAVIFQCVALVLFFCRPAQPWTWRAHQIVQIHHQKFIWLKTSWCPKGTLYSISGLYLLQHLVFSNQHLVISNFQWSTTLSSLPERYQKRLPGVRNVDPSTLHKYHWQILGDFRQTINNVETHQEQRFWKEWLIFEIDNDSKTTQLLLMGVDPASVQLSWNINSDVFFLQRSLAYFFVH